MTGWNHCNKSSLMFHDQLDVVLLQRWSTAAQYSGVRSRKDTDPLPCRPFIDFWKFNLTFKLFLTTTPQLLIYCVLHYLTFLISADVHEVNFFHCFGSRSVNMYTSPSHCCTGPISNDDKGCCRCVWCFHVCVISLWWSQFIVAISHWAVIRGCQKYSHH